MRKIFIPALTFVLLMLVSLLCFSKAPAKEEDKKAEKVKGEYAGAEICQTCHPKVYEQLSKTAMGTLCSSNARTQCKSPRSRHRVSKKMPRS